MLIDFKATLRIIHSFLMKKKTPIPTRNLEPEFLRYALRYARYALRYALRCALNFSTVVATAEAALTTTNITLVSLHNV